MNFSRFDILKVNIVDLLIFAPFVLFLFIKNIIAILFGLFCAWFVICILLDVILKKILFIEGTLVSVENLSGGKGISGQKFKIRTKNGIKEISIKTPVVRWKAIDKKVKIYYTKFTKKALHGEGIERDWKAFYRDMRVVGIVFAIFLLVAALIAFLANKK